MRGGEPTLVDLVTWMGEHMVEIAEVAPTDTEVYWSWLTRPPLITSAAQGDRKDLVAAFLKDTAWEYDAAPGKVGQA